jgi:histidinol-phosphate phosphatase family protein
MSATPILFVDRDGTLIEEPSDFQIDRFDKLRFVAGVIPAMLRLRDAGYQFVMVTNQDGLGSEQFPRADFDGPHGLMLQVFESQGIRFRDVLIDTSLPADNAPTRKPAASTGRDRPWSAIAKPTTRSRATSASALSSCGPRSSAASGTGAALPMPWPTCHGPHASRAPPARHGSKSASTWTAAPTRS